MIRNVLIDDWLLPSLKVAHQEKISVGCFLAELVARLGSSSSRIRVCLDDEKYKASPAGAGGLSVLQKC